MEEHLKNTKEKNSQILQRTLVAIKRILDISKSTKFPKISVELKLNLISFLCVSTVIDLTSEKENSWENEKQSHWE